MTVRRIVINLESNDFSENQKFYENLLGLEVSMDLGWIMTFGSPSNPVVQLTVIRKDLTAPVNANLTIEVDDVVSVYAIAIKNGLEIVYPLTDEPWGVRRFFVLDPNGQVVNIMSHSTQSSNLSTDEIS